MRLNSLLEIGVNGIAADLRCNKSNLHLQSVERSPFLEQVNPRQDAVGAGFAHKFGIYRCMINQTRPLNVLSFSLTTEIDQTEGDTPHLPYLTQS
jgi:hypothetical protein